MFVAPYLIRFYFQQTLKIPENAIVVGIETHKVNLPKVLIFAEAIEVQLNSFRKKIITHAITN